MAIVDGSTILASDVSTAYDTALAQARAAHAELPSLVWWTLQYRDVNSTTNLWRRSTTLIMPDDMLIEELAVQSGDMAGTVTVTLTSPSMIEAITLTGVVTSPGISKLTRYFADSTKPQQVLLKGSQVTLTVATTDAGGTQTVSVSLGLVSYRRRS